MPKIKPSIFPIAYEETATIKSVVNASLQLPDNEHAYIAIIHIHASKDTISVKKINRKLELTPSFWKNRINFLSIFSTKDQMGNQIGNILLCTLPITTSSGQHLKIKDIP